MSHLLYRIGNLAGRHPWRIIAAWVFRGRRDLRAQLLPRRWLRRDVQPARVRVAGAPPTPSRTASPRRRCTPPTSSSTPTKASPRRRRGRGRPRGPPARRRPHVVAVTSPTTRADRPSVTMGKTAFATVGFDTEKIGPPSTTPPRTPSRRLRDAGIQVEYDGGLGYAKVADGRQQRDDRDPHGGRHPGDRVRLAGRDEPADRGGTGRHRGRQQRHRHHGGHRRGAGGHRRRRASCSGWASASTTRCSSCPGTART